MNWTTLHDKIIVRRAPEVTEIAGLTVPDQAREKQNVGTVVSVGQGRIVSGSLFLVPLVLQVGDTVLFNKFAGVPLEEADDLLILREDEVLAYQRVAE